MSRFPRHSSSLIILRDDRVLMLKRNSNVTFRDVHTFPGGRLEDTDKKLANIHKSQIDVSHK
jgi:ADP-ribose pyrophosphatase YjhB (NUDIX family)